MNELHGTEFGGALSELRLAARVHLPQLANQYAIAARATADTRETEPDVFTRDPYFGDVHGIWESWNDLRNLYENAMARSSANLWDVGVALGQALDAFKAQDSEAASELDRIVVEEINPRFKTWTTWDGGEPPLPPDPQETPSPMAEERGKRQGY